MFKNLKIELALVFELELIHFDSAKMWRKKKLFGY